MEREEINLKSAEHGAQSIQISTVCVHGITLIYLRIAVSINQPFSLLRTDLSMFSSNRNLSPSGRSYWLWLGGVIVADSSSNVIRVRVKVIISEKGRWL